ncbi:hypothetical protein DERP_007859 [Dermatophagoides pteronyssinus]|uniref:Uncharacterized protein n=1 Tax=Dermatophagoides pteronyssinus TaxID=6956 RepID=A0ABQ8ISX7_DERPT|nr:hypothetical protein DERP_007859 [Dermatophagoides pteronyssinus]
MMMNDISHVRPSCKPSPVNAHAGCTNQFLCFVIVKANPIKSNQTESINQFNHLLVLPDASKPNINIRISFEPKIFDKNFPIIQSNINKKKFVKN